MAVMCPYCQRPVEVDAAGNSACGHLRGASGVAPLWTPPATQTPAAPPSPQSAAPPPPAWGEPSTPVPPAWGQPMPPQPTGGWAPPPANRGNGCGRGCGCALGIGLLAVLAIAFLIALGGGQFSFQLGTGDTAPSRASTDDAGGGTADPSEASGEPPAAVTPLAGTITAGAPTTVGTQAVKPGRDVTFTAPEDGPIAGTVITIPADAYKNPRTFSVSASTLTVSGYGGLVKPVSDLITIEAGGGYANRAITLKVPVTVSPGAFALGFYLLDDGSLEPMPLVTEDAASITVATRHFSSFFIAEIAKAALPANIGTGFRVHEDDFQDVNYGDYIAPWGHCAGQSISAMWYFEERKLANGAPQLYGRYDNDLRTRTPARWEDDELVYRLAGSVQRDMSGDLQYSTAALLFLRDLGADEYQWLAFRYAMLVTGLPQDTVIRDTANNVAHNMVVYAATPTGLWVADPNKPGQLRTIHWNAATQAFKPYEGGLTAKGTKYAFDKIGFLGKTAFVNWAQVGKRWAELDAGTIGDGLFPGGTFKVAELDAAGAPVREAALVNGATLTTTAPTIHFVSSDPALTFRIRIFANGEERSYSDGPWFKPTLPMGNVDLDFYIAGRTHDDWKPIDYVRFHVVTPAPSLSPAPAPTATPTRRPTPAPSPTFDCSRKPTGGQIEQLNWSLHCQAIGGG